MAFRVAVVGCGSMSSTGHGPSHARLAREMPEVELVACCDLDQAKAQKYAERFGFAQVYTDLDAMISAEQPDALSVITPVEYTSRVFCQAVAHGRPTFTEKPPGLTVAELDTMIAAAGEIITQVAFNRRFQPLVRKLKEQLPAPEVLQHIRYDFCRVNRPDADFSTTAVHGIDTVRHLAGADFAKLSFHYQPLPDEGPTVCNVFIDGAMTSGATCHLAFLPCCGSVVERATVMAKDHTWYLELPMWGGHDSPGRLQHVVKRDVAESWSGADITDGTEAFEANGFYAENKSWYADLLAGRRPSCDLKDARQSVAVMEAYRNMAATFEC